MKLQFHGLEYNSVSAKYIRRMLNSYSDDLLKTKTEETAWDDFPREQFIAWNMEENVWDVIDNRDGDCYCEGFRNYQNAIKWLHGDEPDTYENLE